MKILTRAVDIMNKIIGWILIVMMAVMSIVVIVQVFCRLLGASLPWSEEMSRFLMIYITFLGMAYACRYDQLMSVKFLVDAVPQIVNKILYIAALLIQLAFFVTVFYHGLSITQAVRSQLSPAMRISMSVPYSAMMAGSVAAAANCLYLLIFRVLNIPIDFTLPTAKKEDVE